MQQTNETTFTLIQSIYISKQFSIFAIWHETIENCWGICFSFFLSIW